MTRGRGRTPGHVRVTRAPSTGAAPVRRPARERGGPARLRRGGGACRARRSAERCACSGAAATGRRAATRGRRARGGRRMPAEPGRGAGPVPIGRSDGRQGVMHGDGSFQKGVGCGFAGEAMPRQAGKGGARTGVRSEGRRIAAIGVISRDRRLDILPVGRVVPCRRLGGRGRECAEGNGHHGANAPRRRARARSAQCRAC